ncbi:MAG TPA: DUF296 domain-containing protein [Syntrophomonadaceae bacterium]|nr:DUF296 domain-containing protein [Syntrophomonadaceae bacterium]
MKVQEGRIGRTFFVTFENGEDLLGETIDLARKKGIHTALVILLGAMRTGGMVVGPRECTVPPVGMERNFNDGREILAIGTIVSDENGEPTLHLHGAAGRGEHSLTGCLRKDCEVYLIIEGVIMEMEGIKARRLMDPVLQLKTLVLGKDLA